MNKMPIKLEKKHSKNTSANLLIKNNYMESKNKLLVIGDTHFRLTLSYSDFIDGGRESEEKKIIDFIINQSEDCSSVVFLGDIMNSKTNPPGVIKKVVNFIEKFDGKEIFILKGNHDDYGGKSTLDFLAEVKNKRWHVISDKVEKINNFIFCPYFTRQELDSQTNEEATKKLMKMLPDGDILFVHHAIAGSKSHDIPVSIFNEVVLSSEKLRKKYKQIFGGHVHTYNMMGNIVVTGSIFTYEINETEKFIFKLNTDTMETEKIKLPGRSIYGLTNPTLKDLSKIDKSSIVKVIITEKKTKKEIADLKDKLAEYDASMIIEQIKDERKKLHLEKGTIIDFDIKNLLKLYSDERKIPLNKLLEGLKLIEI